MANRIPAWVEEDFSSFTPESTIEEIEMEGSWLSVHTDTPGEHRFSTRHPPRIPDENYAHGTHVELAGPGTVVFRLKEGVQGLCLSTWSVREKPVHLKARFFDDQGETVRDVEHVAGQEPTHCTCVIDTVGSIFGVEISHAAPDKAGIACVDSFFSLVAG